MPSNHGIEIAGSSLSDDNQAIVILNMVFASRAEFRAFSVSPLCLDCSLSAVLILLFMELGTEQ